MWMKEAVGVVASVCEPAPDRQPGPADNVGRQPVHRHLPGLLLHHLQLRHGPAQGAVRSFHAVPTEHVMLEHPLNPPPPW